MKTEDVTFNGVNNEYIQNVTFDFSQVDYKISKIVFSDGNTTKPPRFSIPENLVGSKPENE